MNHRFFLFFFVILTFSAVQMFATGDGVAGPTIWQTGCGACHGAQSANTTITIEGTNTVVVNGTLQLKAVISNASPALTVGGVNITALNQLNEIQPGLKVVTGSGTKLVDNQITQSAPKATDQGLVEFDFEYTAPSTPGNVLIRVAACMNVDDANATAFDQWNRLTNPFIVTIIENSAPNFLLKQNSLNFGTVSVGLNKVQQMKGVIKNTGNSPLTITGSNFTGTNSGEFKIAPNGLPDSPIEAGDSADVILEFTPTGSGVRTAIFSINSNAEGGARTISLSGIGKQPAILQINGTQFAVGNANVGKTASKVFTGFIKNIGEDTLRISSIGVAGNDETMFSIENGTNPVNVLPSDSLAVSVSFTPTSKGNKSTFLVIAANIETPADIIFTGIGTEGNLRVTPTTYDFGNIQVNEPASQVINNALSNIGNGPVTITGYTLATGSSSPFGVLSPAPIEIANGTVSPFVVSFTPTTVGEFIDTILFASDNPTPVSLIVKGKGVQAGAITLSTSQLTFGEVIIGQTSELTFTIRNGGSEPCTITNAIASGSNAFKPTLPATPIIPPNDSVSIKIVFEPTVEGDANASISAQIPCDVNSPFTVTLSGTGKLPSSVAEGVNATSIEVTPHPIGSNSMITISSQKPMMNAIASIVDVNGREVFSVDIPNQSQQYSFNWNTSDRSNIAVTSGIYKVVVRDQMNILYVKSISVIK
jgi:hypothetical protein